MHTVTAGPTVTAVDDPDVAGGPQDGNLLEVVLQVVRGTGTDPLDVAVLLGGRHVDGRPGGVAGLSMRRILINYAHKRTAQKRGGGAPVATFEDGMAPRDVHPEELIDLDDALKRLEQLNERQAEVVTYRFFGGLTQKEIAEVLGVSEPTVRRDWRLARAWLSRKLRRDAADDDSQKGAPA
jgi:hypothetical protein